MYVLNDTQIKLDFAIVVQYSAHVNRPKQVVGNPGPLGNRAMRLAKFIQFLSLFLRALALFGGEVGESACFVDDISNDFIQAPTSPAQKTAALAPANVMSQGSGTLAEELILKLLVTPSIEPASSASDLLRLLSIQRK